VILFGHAYRPLIVRLVFRTIVVANAKPQHFEYFPSTVCDHGVVGRANSNAG
jgi:hypothetical protein